MFWFVFDEVENNNFGESRKDLVKGLHGPALSAGRISIVYKCRYMVFSLTNACVWISKSCILFYFSEGADS